MREKTGLHQDGVPSGVGQDARNQALFREVNERIEQLAVGVGGHNSYICECGDRRCTRPVELTRAEYQAVRKYANRFAVLPDHVDPATETVVEQYGRYSVVETRTGDKRTRRE